MRRAAIALAVATALVAGCHRKPPAAVGVSGGGITLASSTITLPADDGHLPPGTNAELVEATCTACHSAAMMLSQPPLTTDQWQAEVKKMREAYHASVADADVPAIVAYLGTLPGQRPMPASR